MLKYQKKLNYYHMMQRVIALSASILAQLYYLCKIHLIKDKKRKLATLISTLQLLTPKQLK